MTTRSSLVTIFGYGPTGQAVADLLRGRGQPVRIAQRKRPDDLPDGVAFAACDATLADEVARAMDGAGQAVITTGFAYSGKVWKDAWPKATLNFIAASGNARIVHVDNLYMYGPQTKPLHESMPMRPSGVKPAARAEATRLWMKAASEGRILWAALRAPDFYGPGVERSHMGQDQFQALARGKAAMMLMQPDLPHAFAYVPDIARAAVSLLDAPDDAFNQAWHVPCAPTRTPRQILQLAADALGEKLRISAMPAPMLALLGLVSPMLREAAEMQFTWNRPYHVDASRFSARFWSDATPFEVGIPLTARAARDALLAPRRA